MTPHHESTRIRRGHERGQESFDFFREPLARCDVFSSTAARMRDLNAAASSLSPSRRSIARRVFPSRLALNRREGSASEAPFAKVSLTTLLYVSPVQRMPSCDQTGTPAGFEG